MNDFILKYPYMADSINKIYEFKIDLGIIFKWIFKIDKDFINNERLFFMLCVFIECFNDEDMPTNIDDVQKLLVRVLDSYYKYTATRYLNNLMLDLAQNFKFSPKSGCDYLYRYIRTRKIFRVETTDIMYIDNKRELIFESMNNFGVIYFNIGGFSKDSIYLGVIQNGKLKTHGYDGLDNKENKYKLLKSYTKDDSIEFIIIFKDIRDNNFLNSLVYLGR